MGAFAIEESTTPKTEEVSKPEEAPNGAWQKIENGSEEVGK
jgi:hypothetical protein